MAYICIYTYDVLYVLDKLFHVPGVLLLLNTIQFKVSSAQKDAS